MVASGDQVVVAFGAHRAVVATGGATLRGYDIDGRSVLDGFAADEECPDGRGQVLMPWPNRIADGRYEFAGTRQELPINEPELGHAIHGLVRRAVWDVEPRLDPTHQPADVARFHYRLRPQPGYPFDLDLCVDYRLSTSGLTVTFGATNTGTAPCPFGAGAHPYLAFPSSRADAVELCVRAAEWLEVDARSIPRARRPVLGSALDFRQPRPIGTARIDHAFSHLERDGDGIAQVLLRHGRDEIRLWLDRSWNFVQLYTGDTVPDRTRRRRSVAVEPMTCAPNAFNSGDGLLVLAPGGSFEGRWGIAAS